MGRTYAFPLLFSRSSFHCASRLSQWGCHFAVSVSMLVSSARRCRSAANAVHCEAARMHGSMERHRARRRPTRCRTKATITCGRGQVVAWRVVVRVKLMCRAPKVRELWWHLGTSSSHPAKRALGRERHSRRVGFNNRIRASPFIHRCCCASERGHRLLPLYCLRCIVL